MKKIVVTGMGAVTPVGIGVENYWNNITAGASGIDTIKTFDPSELAVQIAGEVKNFNPSDYLPKDLIRKTDPFMQYAYIAAEEAMKQSGTTPAIAYPSYEKQMLEKEDFNKIDAVSGASYSDYRFRLAILYAILNSGQL